MDGSAEQVQINAPTVQQTDDGAAASYWWRIDGRDGPLHLEALSLPPVVVANATTFSPDGRRVVSTSSSAQASGPIGQAANTSRNSSFARFLAARACAVASMPALRPSSAAS